MTEQDQQHDSEYVAISGESIAKDIALAEKDTIINALRCIYDPEIPVNLYDLGLIYEIKQKNNGDVIIVMTLTTPACPVAGELPKQVADKAAEIEGVGIVNVQLTWEPVWNTTMMSEEAKMILDMV